MPQRWWRNPGNPDPGRTQGRQQLSKGCILAPDLIDILQTHFLKVKNMLQRHTGSPWSSAM